MLLAIEERPRTAVLRCLRFDRGACGPAVDVAAGGSRVRKTSNDPDVSVVLGADAASEGVLEMEARVVTKGDEMWIGVTDCASFVATARPPCRLSDAGADPELHRVSGGEIRTHRRIWAYCDGSRRPSFPCAGVEQPSPPPPFGSGDVIGVRVDFALGSLQLSKNGVPVATFNRMEPGVKLWPFVALDLDGDVVELK